MSGQSEFLTSGISDLVGIDAVNKTNRTVLHSDLNNFFASAECRLDPSLCGKPVAVTGDPETRHGIVLAKNYEAKKYGIQTAEPLFQALKKCPSLVCVRPHYEVYREFSEAAKKIYSDYTELVEPFGIDECWLDVSDSRRIFGDGKKIADEIRLRIKKELGITVSVGVSFNKVFAKLGSDLKKPDATTVISADDFKSAVWPLPVEELLFVGRAVGGKLKKCGINTIGKLALAPLSGVRDCLGKTGVMLWKYANGLDFSPVTPPSENDTVKSVSCGRTAPRDLVCDDDVRCALYPLCENVSSRLRVKNLMCRTVSLSVRYSDFTSLEKQKKLTVPCRTSCEIFSAAYELFKITERKKPVRALTVCASNLDSTGEVQLSLDPDIQKIVKREKLEAALDTLRAAYGKGAVFRALSMTDSALSNIKLSPGSRSKSFE